MTEACSQWVGRVVNGEFELKKYLGGSEPSAVFLTEVRGQPPQPAAIKLLAADLAVAELQLARWERAQSLSHPHLIRILQTGRCTITTDADAVVFAVMEYAEEDLAQILPVRALTPQETREMLGPTLDALAFLHRQGFVHGHLKPANIFAVNDQLKLASDAICRADETTSRPRTPSVYDAPEMAAADGIRSPAADVWSLGMVLAEILTLQLPRLNQNDPAAVVDLPKDLPAPFLEIVRGCLQRDPERRLTLAAIAAQLNGASSQPPARTTATLNNSFKELSIRRFVLPAMVALGAVVALVAGVGLLRYPEPKPAEVKSDQQPKSQKPDPGHPTSSRTSAKPSPTISAKATKPTADESPAPPPSETQAPARNIVVTRNPPTTSAPNGSGADSAVLRQVLPNVPQTATDTIQGTVRVNVRVTVDAAGNVSGAEYDSPPHSKYIASLALQASHDWKFTPDAGREFVVHFEFTNTGSRAFATRAP